jgi:hypothetical protein
MSVEVTIPMRPRRLRRLLCLVALGAITAAAALAVVMPKAQAMPDPYMPLPPVWCPGGGIQTGWGGWCDGKTFPDGTKLHMDSFVAPFVGRVWNPIVCVVADAPAPPPLAPGGCAGLLS